jgi:hypothetical protein
VPPPPNPAQLAALQAEIAKSQAAAESARLEVETKAIERDMRALELRLAAAKADGADNAGKAVPDEVVRALAEEIARLHGMIAELAARMPQN